MADAKITDLADATVPLAGTELVEVVQGGVNVKVAAHDLAADPTDPSVAATWVDDFIFVSNETGEVGAGWSFTNGSCVAVSTVVADHPGIMRRTTAATASNVASLYPNSAVGLGVSQFSDVDETTWVIAPGSTAADYTIRVGFFDDMGILGNPVGAHFEKLSTDTNWFAKTVVSGPTATRTDTTVAMTTGWFKMKVRRISSTSYGFTLNGGSEITISTNTPTETTKCMPGMQVIPTTTTARFVDVDFASGKYRALSR